MTMKRSSLLLLILFCIASAANAQLPQTRLYSLSRSGGQIGTVVEVQITSGDDLEEITDLEFSHPGITAVPKSTEKDGVQTPVPNTFLVTIQQDVPVGLYEVRCRGLFGLSNPRRFVVGQRSEAEEVEDNNTPDKATPMVLNSTIDARLQAGSDVDWFRLTAKQGERIVLDCWAERLDSKMDAALTVFDASGYRRLDYSRNVKGSDPTLLFEVPADGEYLVKIHDQTFLNGNEYYYRLAVHTGPYVEFTHPTAGKAKSTQTITLFGYNLPNGKPTEQALHGKTLEAVDVQVPIPAEDSMQVETRVQPLAAGTDAISYRLRSPQGMSNPVRIGIAPTEVVVEQEPNNTSSEAQELKVPVEVCGQFAEVGDSDTFRFSAKAGKVYFIEAIAERMGTATDPYLIVQQVTKQEDGTEQFQRLTAQDDVATTLQANVFDTKTDDPAYKLSVPADGTYEVTVRDRYWESRGAVNLTYRLAIRAESPDYRLVALPSSPTAGQTWPIGLRQGDNFPVSIYAFREHGFEGPITVSAAKLPAGFQCPEIVIGEKESSGTLVVSTTSDAKPGPQEFSIQGHAEIDHPETLRKIESATKELETARKPIPDLEKAVAAADAEQQKAQQAQVAATQASTENPDDAGLKKKLEQAQQALDKANTALAAAKQKLADGVAARGQAEQALANAELQREQRRRKVTRKARAGTIAWSNANNVPAIARLTDQVRCSVIDEPAPFQILAELPRIEANQSRQILLSVKLEKRSNFDNKVTLTPQGLPKTANIDLKIDPIDKGQTEQIMRLFIKDNAPAGIYTLWLNSTGQVSYQRNPQKAERLKQEHEVLKQQLEAANNTLKSATEQKNAAVAALDKLKQQADQAQKTVVDKTTAVTAMKQGRQQAEQTLKQQQAELAKAEAELKAATTQVAQAEMAVNKAKTELQQAQQALQASEKQTAEATNVVKEIKQAVAALQQQNAEEEEVKAKLAEAEAKLTAAKQKLEDSTKVDAMAKQTVANAENNVKELNNKQSAAVKTMNLAQQSVEAANKGTEKAQQEYQAKVAALEEEEQALAAATTMLNKVKEELKAAGEQKNQKEQVEREAQAAANALTAKNKVAEKAATDAANAAKAKNINFTPPSTPIVVEVRTAPCKLTATADAGGTLKQGATLNVNVKVARQNGFAGPVTLSLPSILPWTGVTAEAVTIPADQSEGTLVLAASKDATTGELANLVIRGTAEFNGKAAVDIPVKIVVNK